MNSISLNPYRILGVLSSATEREILKQKNKLNLLASLGQTASLEYDLPALGGMPRDTHSIQEAASQIEQPKQKIFHALFWFCLGDRIDEIAINHLKEGDLDKGHEIWEKYLMGGSITGRTHTSATNLSTLLLWKSIHQRPLNIQQFQLAIDLKRKAIVSDSFPEFVARVTGSSFVIDTESLLTDYLKKIVDLTRPYQSPNQLSRIKLIDTFKDFPESSRRYLSNLLTATPLQNIEKWIAKAKENRTDTPGDGEIFGEELFNNTRSDLQFLAQAWGMDNVQYQQTVNKVAEEIRLCVHDFFTEYRDSDSYDPGEPALNVAEMAQEVGPTGQVKSRVDEMIDFLEEWVADQPERERQRQLVEPLNFIGQQLKQFQEANDSVQTAKALLTNCEPKLSLIREITGRSDELYIQISDAIVSNAMGMLVAFINKANERTQYNPAEFGSLTTSALQVQKSFSRFDLSGKVQQRVQNNLTALKKLHTPFVTLHRQLLTKAQAEMSSIMEFKFGRPQSEKDRQISQQNAMINRIKQDLKVLEDALT